LVSYQAGRRTGSPQVVESPSAVTGIMVKLMEKREPTSVYMKPENRGIEAKREGKYLIVQVPDFAIHTAVVFDWQ